jgi:hypothetical protein
MKKRAAALVLVVGVVGLSSSSASADVPTYQTRCPAVRVGSESVTVDTFGSVRCSAAGAVLRSYVSTKPKVGKTTVVKVGTVRWSCSRMGDKSGAAWRYRCTTTRWSVLGGRLFRDSVYRRS